MGIKQAYQNISGEKLDVPAISARAMAGEKQAGQVLDETAKYLARAIAAIAADNKGEVGHIFHDADYYVTNQRDQAFKTTIEQDYPDIKIVVERTFTWLGRCRRLAKDWETLIENSQNWLFIASIRRMSRHFARKIKQSDF